MNSPSPGGLKVTLMVHDAPGPRLDPQVWVWEKLEPLRVMRVIVSVVLPVLVSVVVSVLDWLINTLPKSRLGGEKLTTVPAPFRVAFCGPSGALSLIDRVAVRVPICVGVKLTSIVQLAPGATEPPQLLVRAKSPESAPEIVMLVILSGIVP